MPKKRKPKRDELVLLKDLIPRQDPKGGAASKPVFGQHTTESDPSPGTAAPRRGKRGEA